MPANSQSITERISRFSPDDVQRMVIPVAKPDREGIMNAHKLPLQKSDRPADPRHEGGGMLFDPGNGAFGCTPRWRTAPPAKNRGAPGTFPSARSGIATGAPRASPHGDISAIQGNAVDKGDQLPQPPVTGMDIASFGVGPVRRDPGKAFFGQKLQRPDDAHFCVAGGGGDLLQDEAGALRVFDDRAEQRALGAAGGNQTRIEWPSRISPRTRRSPSVSPRCEQRTVRGR